MISAKTTLAAVAASGLAAMLFTTQLSAQQRTTFQQRTSPAPANPNLGLAQTEIAGQETMRCRAFSITVTLRGVVLHCSDFKTATTRLLVVDESQYPGFGQAVIANLQHSIPLSKLHELDSSKEGSFVSVRYRQASAKSRAICALTGLSDVIACGELLAVNQ